MSAWRVSDIVKNFWQYDIPQKLIELAARLLSTLSAMIKSTAAFLWSRFRWSALRAIGSSQAVRMGSVVMGIVGYILLLSAEIRDRLAPVADYAVTDAEAKPWTYNWVATYRWEFLFIGSLALTLGSIVFLFCPRIIKKHPDSEAYATNESSVYDLYTSPNLSIIRKFRENLNALNYLSKGLASRKNNKYSFLKDDNSINFHNTFYNTAIAAMAYPENRIQQPTLPNKASPKISLVSDDPIPRFIDSVITTHGKQVPNELKEKVRENALKRWQDFKYQFHQIFASHLDGEFSRKIRATYLLGNVARQIMDENLILDHAHDSYLRPKFMQGDYKNYDRITFWSLSCGILFYFGILLVAIPSVYTSLKVISVVGSKVFSAN